jgi:hypothetical protein
MNFSYISDFSTIRSSDEKNEELNPLEDTINSQFEECFSKIFALNNNIDEDFDKDFFLDPKEKPDIKANLFSSEDIKDKTADKSKEKLCNNETGSKNFNESSSDEMEKSLYDYQNIFNNLMDKDMNSLNIIIQKNEKEETKKECENFLGKKRNLFKVDYPNYFSIFSYGQYNEYTRQVIEDVLDNYYGKDSKHKENSSKDDGKKKPHPKKKNVLKRKENSDNIRKKIKARFLKVLKNSINQRLKLAGSKKLFNFLPQAFICNVSKQKNKAVLNLSLKELFQKNLCEGEKSKDLKNYYHNLSVLEYLEQNYDIGEKSNYNNFKNMKYYQIFNEYLKSKEFEMEIASLKQEKENDKYIRNYIIKANNFLNFFDN